MAHTNSLAWPNMFNVAQNTVSVLEDNVAIVNRVKLLILTEPTEVYNSPQYGVGLKRYLFQYNNENTKAIIQDRIREQIRIYEPEVNADNITFVDGLVYSGNASGQADSSVIQNYNELKFTVNLETVYSETVSITLNDNQEV